MGRAPILLSVAASALIALAAVLPAQAQEAAYPPISARGASGSEDPKFADHLYPDR